MIAGLHRGGAGDTERLSTIANVMLATPMPFVPEEDHGEPVIMGLFAYVGEVDRRAPVIAPFRALAEAARRHGAADAVSEIYFPRARLPSDGGRDQLLPDRLDGETAE